MKFLKQFILVLGFAAASLGAADCGHSVCLQVYNDALRAKRQRLASLPIRRQVLERAKGYSVNFLKVNGVLLVFSATAAVCYVSTFSGTYPSTAGDPYGIGCIFGLCSIFAHTCDENVPLRNKFVWVPSVFYNYGYIYAVANFKNKSLEAGSAAFLNFLLHIIVGFFLDKYDAFGFSPCIFKELGEPIQPDVAQNMVGLNKKRHEFFLLAKALELISFKAEKTCSDLDAAKRVDTAFVDAKRQVEQMQFFLESILKCVLEQEKTLRPASLMHADLNGLKNKAIDLQERLAALHLRLEASAAGSPAEAIA